MPAKSEKYPWQPLEDVQGTARLPDTLSPALGPLAGVPLAPVTAQWSHAQGLAVTAQWSHARGTQVRHARALAAGDALEALTELAHTCPN
jgi:hypothetical protein